MNDRRFLDRAIALAALALDDDEGGPFGAVVVRDGEILGEARNRVLALHDPTAHAEVLAIREAAARLGTHDLSGAVIYTTSEPCPMCHGAITWAGIRRVVYAVDRSGAARAGFADAAMYEELQRPGSDPRVAMEHHDLDEAHDVLRRWRARPDRKPY